MSIATSNQAISNFFEVPKDNMSVSVADDTTVQTGESGPSVVSSLSAPTISSTAASSLLRKSDKIENEIATRTLESSHDRQIKKLIRKSTEGMTINKLDISRLDLIGRDNEKKTLRECLDRVVTTTQSTAPDSVDGVGCGRELVLISGHAGTGKSALGMTLSDLVEDMNGAFVVGKFDYSRDEPYTGIAAFCREICGILLMESPEIRLVIGNKLTGELGNDLMSMLINVVPDLEDVLVGSSYNNNALEYASLSGQRGNDKNNNRRDGVRLGSGAMSEQQVNHAFRLFVRIICSKYKPLVVLLDDLQWADISSLDVLEVLITDIENKGLLVLGCYRSNEVDESHVFLKYCRVLKEKSNRSGTETSCIGSSGHGGHGVTELDIGNLSLEQVQQVITTLLDQEDRVEHLAQICHKRTQGNPFFLLSFLNMLQSESYLKFNLGTLKWTWEVDKIEKETASTENIVELMMNKMNQVNPDLGCLLQIASLLGSRFEKKILFLVWNQINEDSANDGDETLAKHLEQAIDQMFIEAVGPNSYQWVHDKVQEAALSMIPKEEQLEFKFDVGMILVDNLDEQELDSLLFVVVHLLDAKECLDDSVNAEIATLSAKAANKARKLSAFSSAATYANIGLRHMTAEDKWKTNYDLALQLYCTAAECESVLGKSKPDNKVQIYATEVLAQGRDILDKVPVYYVLALAMGKMGRFVDSNNLCIDAINQLKVLTIPTNGLVLGTRTVTGLFSTKKLLVSAKVEDFPCMTDPKQIATMKLLDLTCSYAFQAKNILLLLFCTVKMVRLTLEHGICSTAPSAISQYGGLVSGVLNDLEAGTCIGEMALEMVKRLKGQANEALVIARTWGFMMGYSRPSHLALKQFLHGYSEGMKFGDTEMCSWCLFNHAQCSLLVGKSLRTIREDCRIYIPYMHDLGWTVVAAATTHIQLTIQYLIGEDDASSDLFKPVEGQPEFSDLAKFSCRSAACTYSVSYKEGADFAIETGNVVEKAAPGHVLLQSDVFTRGVCLYAMARETSSKKYKKAAQATRKTILSWIKQGSLNLKHQICLLNAEEEAIRGKMEKASSLYREGIVVASRGGFLRDAALINERYANFMLNDLKDKEQAGHYAEESIKRYEEWGAVRTVERIKSKYAQVLQDTVPASICGFVSLEGSGLEPSTTSLGMRSSH